MGLRGFEEMSASITIPSGIVEKAKKLGIDLRSLAVEAILKELRLDPNEEAEIRLELAEKSLEEAKDYVKKKDLVQASEKLYKAVEECLKILGQLHKLPQYEKAKTEGRWWTQLLGKSARKLSKILKEPRIKQTWAIAYEIYTWGFHEAKYSIEDIEDDVKYVEWIVEYTKKAVQKLSEK